MRHKRDTTPTLGYWDVRGRGNPIRLLLEHVGQDFHFKGYGRFPQDGWAEDRTKLGLLFPNLPYLIDGEVKLTQSNAIMRYLGRKYGLVANEGLDLVLQDVLEGTLDDIRNGFSRLVYACQDFETEKLAWRKDTLQPFLAAMDANVLKSKQYLLGHKVNYNDFVMVEMLDVYCKLFPDLLDKYENIQHYYRAMMAIPTVEEFMESDRNSPHINGPHAKWGA